MSRFLHYAFFCLFIMFFGTVNAQKVVTFDVATDKGNITTSSAHGKDTIRKEDVMISITDGCLGLETEYRIYAKSNILVSSSAGKITKIVFTCTASSSADRYGPNNITAENGTYNFEAGGFTGTWTGSEDDVKLKTSGQVRIKKIDITINGSTEPDPEPEPDPNPELQEVTSIKDFKELADNTEAKLTLTNARVLYAGKSEVFIKDATGAIDFYKTDVTFNNNDVLNGSIIGKKSVYNSMPQLVKGDNFKNEITSAAGSEIIPTVVPIDEIGKAYECDLVKIENVSVDSINNNLYATLDGASIQIYDKFKVVSNAVDKTKTYSIEGIVVPYKDIFEICPIKDFTASETTEMIEVNNIAEFKALPVKTDAKLNLTNAKVLYAWKSSNGNNLVFVRDLSGAIEFYNIGFELATNNDLNGSLIAKYELYKNMPEAVNVAGKTNADELAITDGAEAEPKVLQIAEIKDNVCDLVLVNDVQLTSKEYTYKDKDGNDKTATDYYAFIGSDSIQIYNGFHLPEFDDLASMVNDSKYNVKGIVTVSGTTYEIYPIGITQVVSGISVSATENKNDENAPMYNIAGQRVDASYKGVVIRNGKKYLLK